MGYKVFTQLEQPGLPISEIVGACRSLSGLGCRVGRVTDRGQELFITDGTNAGIDVTLSVRPCTSADYRAAHAAEHKGQAAGMSQLAGRCPSLWELDTPATDHRLFFELLAALASVALGPVLPPDHSTLFGVRGARQRANGS